MGKTQITSLAPYAPITVNIRGKVSYSHITKKIEGEELNAVNQRKAMKGGIMETTPYYALTIRDARILNDGTIPQIVIDYLTERMTNQTLEDNTQTTVYYGKDKSANPIAVAYSAEAGNLAGQGITERNMPLQNELAVGLDITIGVKIYKITKGNMTGRVGVGIDYILVNEPIRYYENKSGIAAALAAQGVTYTPAATTATPVQAQAAPQEQPVATQNVGVADTAPQAVSPMATPVQQATAQPMGVAQTAPVSPVPTQAAAQVQQAAAQPMFQQPVYPQGGANYGQPTQAAPQAQPQQTMPGLSYTPNN